MGLQIVWLGRDARHATPPPPRLQRLNPIHPSSRFSNRSNVLSFRSRVWKHDRSQVLVWHWVYSRFPRQNYNAIKSSVALRFLRSVAAALRADSRITDETPSYSHVKASCSPGVNSCIVLFCFLFRWTEIMPRGSRHDQIQVCNSSLMYCFHAGGGCCEYCYQVTRGVGK